MSQKSSGYERIEGDRYFTPHWVTEALISVERFAGTVWDPAAGAGHIMTPFLRAQHTVLGTDIEPADLIVDPGDFFDAVPHIGRAAIVTNPPYGKGGRMAVRFIERALLLMEPVGGKVAMLLRVDFDSANGRRPIFNDHPAFAAKYTLTKRIRWANLPQVDENGDPTSGPTDNHAWFVWDWQKRRDTHRAYGYLP